MMPTEPITEPILMNAAALAALIGRTTNAVNVAACRKDWDLIPLPVKVGRRNFWERPTVNDWIQKKTDAAAQAEEQRQARITEAKADTPKKLGRPRKADTAKRRVQ